MIDYVLYKVEQRHVVDGNPYHYENVKAAKKNKFQTTCGKHFPVLSLFMTYHRVCK